MPSYTGTVHTEWSPQEAFAYMAAFEHTSDWDPSCAVAERNTPGDVGVGTRFRLEFELVASKTTELVYEVVEYDAPRRMVLQADTGTVKSTDTILVEPSGTGADVTYEAVLEGEGAAKLAQPFLAIGIRRAGQKAEGDLEEVLSKPAPPA